jgi:hypothetical protein
MQYQRFFGLLQPSDCARDLNIFVIGKENLARGNTEVCFSVRACVKVNVLVLVGE